MARSLRKGSGEKPSTSRPSFPRAVASEIGESLEADFAAFEERTTIHRGRKCWTCNLPPDVLSVVEKLYRSGRGPKILKDWLISKGYNAATVPKLTSHFERHGREA